MVVSAWLMFPALAWLWPIARDIADAGQLRKFLEVLARAVIEDVDMQLIRRIIDIDGG